MTQYSFAPMLRNCCFPEENISKTKLASVMKAVTELQSRASHWNNFLVSSPPRSSLKSMLEFVMNILHCIRSIRKWRAFSCGTSFEQTTQVVFVAGHLYTK